MASAVVVYSDQVVTRAAVLWRASLSVVRRRQSRRRLARLVTAQAYLARAAPDTDDVDRAKHAVTLAEHDIDNRYLTDTVASFALLTHRLPMGDTDDDAADFQTDSSVDVSRARVRARMVARRQCLPSGGGPVPAQPDRTIALLAAGASVVAYATSPRLTAPARASAAALARLPDIEYLDASAVAAGSGHSGIRPWHQPTPAPVVPPYAVGHEGLLLGDLAVTVVAPCSLMRIVVRHSGWQCESCGLHFALGVEHWSCRAHAMDVCDLCVSRLAPGEPVHVTSAIPAAPVDTHGRPTVLPSEWPIFKAVAKRMARKQYRYYLTSLVRLNYAHHGAAALMCRVVYYSQSDKVLSVGALGEEQYARPTWYPELSLLYSRDPLRHRSQTCSSCGPHVLAIYHCVSALCPYGHCFACYSRRAFVSEPFVNVPMLNDYLAPAPQACRPHMCAPQGGPDLTFILDPVVTISVRGIADGQGDRGYAAYSVVGSDLSMMAGMGVYPHVVTYLTVGTGGVNNDVAVLADLEAASESASHIVAQRLVLDLNAHMTLSGIEFGHGNFYSPAQLLATLIVPVVRAFRAAPGRMASAEVLVVLTICGLTAGTWHAYVQDQPDESRFSLLLFQRSILLVHVPALLAGVVRNWSNAHLTRHAWFTLAHAVAYTASLHHLHYYQPSVSERHRSLVTCFEPLHAELSARLARAPSCSSTLVGPSVSAPASRDVRALTSLVKEEVLSPLPVLPAVSMPVVSLPSVACSSAAVAWPRRYITAALHALSRAELVELGLTGVTAPAFAASYDAFVDRHCPSMYSAPATHWPKRGRDDPSNSASRWRREHWTRDDDLLHWTG